MRVFTADVVTGNAGSYVRKLCAHWSHKFAVQVEGERGREQGTIELPAAKCELKASEAALGVRLELKDEADEARIKKVIEEHLQRFGFQEQLEFVWTSSTE